MRSFTTRCFATRCVRACEANCTLEAEYNALPACEAGPDCTGPYPQQCNSSAPCNWDKTLDLLDQPSINITQVTENQTTDLWVPPWTEAICEALSDGFIDAHVACAANPYRSSPQAPPSTAVHSWRRRVCPRMLSWFDEVRV